MATYLDPANTNALIIEETVNVVTTGSNNATYTVPSGCYATLSCIGTGSANGLTINGKALPAAGVTQSFLVVGEGAEVVAIAGGTGANGASISGVAIRNRQ